ncbi:hypothetical protein V8H18_10915 [Lautropia mirabilis]
MASGSLFPIFDYLISIWIEMLAFWSLFKALAWRPAPGFPMLAWTGITGMPFPCAGS